MDNFVVQILPPDWTFDETDDFTPPAELTRNAESGTWTESSGTLIGTSDVNGPAVHIVDLGASLASNSILELEVDITTGDTAGLVFDRYDANNYKFVALDVANDQVILGHATDAGMVVDATYAHDLDPATTYRLKATMQGAGIEVSVDGTPVTSYGFNAALVDGAFGLIVADGTSTFDSLTVRTNDPAFLNSSSSSGSGSLLAAANPLDTSGDGIVSPLDALLVINALNQEASILALSHLDVNGDSFLTPLDALLVINWLNNITLDGGAGGEGFLLDLTDDDELEETIEAIAYELEFALDEEDEVWRDWGSDLIQQ
jgi:hypothetical protein